MSTEEQYIQQRREKLEKLRALGIDVYPRKFEFSKTLQQVREEYEKYSAEELEGKHARERVAGRILTIRGHGKVGFLNLKQEASQVQVYVRKDQVGDDHFAIYECLDMGDFLGVEGEIFKTKTGELTIKAEKITFLAKALRPLPEKWHGLQDVEIRYRQRYLDLLSNPDVRHVFEIRSKIIAEMRRYFDSLGFIEVETPMMQPIAGGALARPFKTHHNALDIDLYLRIAPELYLKRLTVAGLDRVYEINRNFRNEGTSTMHNPEFTMLEFYIAYFDYNQLMDLTENLLLQVADAVIGKRELEFDGKKISLDGPWPRISMKQAMMEIGKLPAEVVEDDERLRQILIDRKVKDARTLHRGKVWDEVFKELVEPHLMNPIFIKDHPKELSPLSKAKPEDPRFVERFELYIRGMEIANAYSELNDPTDQRRRFEDQLRAFQAGDAEAHTMDEDYVIALEYGLPPTGGEGIGIDRLTMLFTNSASIRDVILFPLLKPR